MAQGGYRPPPPPFIGGRQPHEPRRLPPSVIAVPEDAPPVRSRTVALLAVIAAWTVPGPAPQQPRPHVVQEGAAAPEAQPFSSEVSLAAILQHWRASNAAPQQARKLPPQLLSVDDPPFGLKPLLAPRLAPAWWPAQSAPHLTPPSVDDPPFASHDALGAVRAWHAPTASPIVRRHFVVPETAAEGDFVSFVRQPLWARATIDWPAQRRLLPPALIAVPEDDPPFGLRRLASAASVTWFAPAAIKIAPLIAVASADDPPFGRRANVWTAPPQVWRAQGAPRAVIASTDDPPFGAKRQRHGDALPQWPAQARRLAPPASVDDPPFGLRRALPVRAEQSWPAQAAPRALPASVDDPPPDARRSALPALLRAWWRAPPPQTPATVKFVAEVAAAPADDPPFALRRQIWTAAVAQPAPPARAKIAALAETAAPVFTGVDIAYETLRAWFDANWSATPRRFENEFLDPPADLAAFVFFELTTDFVEESEIGSGAPRTNVWREGGEAVFHVLVASGTGPRIVRGLAEDLANLLKGLVLANGVRVGALSIGAGEQLTGDGNYFDLNVTAQWARDDWKLGSD